MNNIIDTHGNPVDADDYEIVEPWFWQRMAKEELCALIATTLLVLLIVATILFSVAEMISTDRRMDLLLTETSLQLQAIADGCLNKGGE